MLYMTKYFLLLSFLSFFFISCVDDDQPYEIGNDKIDVKALVGFIDTFSVKSYTVMLDSVPTSGLSNPAVLIGRHNDPEFGTITANSFFRIILPDKITGSSPTKSYGIQDDYVFDSLKLFLLYNKYYSGDTTVPYTINVHRLEADMQPNAGYFYNNDSIAANPALFGQTTVIPNPNSNDTVWITLDNTFGSELFELMRETDLRVTEAEDFFRFFKGFMLRYDDSDNAIIGFQFPLNSLSTPMPAMRIYYHHFDPSLIREELEFRVQSEDYTSGEGLQFNQFNLLNRVADFPANQKEKLPVSLTSDQSYVLAGVGIVTRLEIPYLKDLFYINDEIRILDAILEIEPVENTYTELTLPTHVSLYATDDLNRWGTQLTDKSGNPDNVTLQIDMLYQEETKYYFDITNFLISKLKEPTDVIPAILLTIGTDDLYMTTSRIVMGSQFHNENKIKLKLYYMKIE
jgi:hypothetical protein